MYTNSGNRILTKYSDFLKQTQGSGAGAGDFPIDTEELPDSFNKKRVNSTSSSISSASSSNFSGRTNSSTSVHGNCRTSHSTVNAQVHQIDAGDAEAAPEPSAATAIVGEIGETSKFSDLFSPSESNALYMRNQLINSEDGKFLQEAIPNYKKELDGIGNSKIDIGSQIPLAAAAAVPLLPPQYSTTSLQHSTGSGGSSSLNPDINSVTLRRELLNNIRAISKATFFEDLYVNNGNLANTQSGPTSTSFPELPESNSRPQTIVSERGEYLVFETQLPNLPSSPSGSNGLDQTKLASIDEWIRNSQENLQSNHSNPPISEENPTNSESENFQEENDKSMQIETDNFKSEQPKVPDSYSYTNYRTMKSVDVENIDKLSQPDFTPGESQSQAIAKVPDSHTSSYNFTAGSNQNEVTMTTNTNSSESTVVKVPSPENEEIVPNNTGATLMHDLHMHDVDELLVNTVVSPAPSTPNSLTNSSTTSTNKTQTYNNAFPKVHYPTVLPTPTRTKPRQRQPQPLYGVPLPGILRRQNMDQWVAKILRFYINGDEHAPKYEFRFRPGRDVRSWDGLCDTLSERLQLSRGVRWIFTLDGQLVQSLDQLRHGRAYVVSSNKKFKALNYGGEVEGSSGNEDSDDQLQPIHRPPSAPPNQKHPPVIRVRRERSLHGVSWGSPQQLSNTSGSETNNNNNVKSKIPLPNTTGRIGAAESVVQAAIDAASSRLGTRVTLPLKQIVRIINGTNPTVQSQVLLNTRVSQDWNDLVKDLGLSVKIPRSSSSRLETIVGRQIQSYSQLRSELKVGNNAFYIYVLNKNGEKKLPKMDDHIKIGAGGGVGVGRSSSHPTIYQASNKTPNVGKLGRIGNQSNNSNQKSNSISTPNLSTTMKLNNPPLNVKIRKSHRKRTEASTYLVPNHHIIRDTDRSP